MARPIAEGDYLIVNAANASVALDVSNGRAENGANILVYNAHYGRPQIFTVTYHADDSVRILSRYSGKAVDVANGDIRPGTNVRIWSWNDSARAQRWDLSEEGAEIEYKGKGYRPYALRLKANNSYVLDPEGTSAASGSNVRLAPYTGEADQRWIFVPLELLSSGGLYEIRTMTDTSYAIDMESWSKANGGQAITWPAHGGNNQKFALLQEDVDRWRIRNVYSGKYLDIKGNAAKDAAPVVQWGEPIDIRHQQWKVTALDTVECEGLECAVVTFGAYGNNSDGNTFMLHVGPERDASKPSNIVNIYTDAGIAAYKWALLPTTATDPHIPVPANLALSGAVGDPSSASSRIQGEAMHPTWTCTRSWTAASANHYEYRYRRRYMSSRNSVWLPWSEFGPWETAFVLQEGTRAWLSDALDGSYDIDDYKNLQFEFQVRCVGVDDTANLVGGVATADLYALFMPTFTFDAAGISPDGLRVGYANDYPCGLSTLYLDGIMADGRDVLLEPIAFDALDAAGAVTVPAGSIDGPIADGTRLTLSYRVSTDQLGAARPCPDAEVLATDDAGGGLDAEPALAAGEGRTLTAAVPYPGARMWLKTSDGIMELANVGSDAASEFSVPYPFGRGFDLYTAVEQGDGWGTDATHVDPDDPLVAGTECHAWTWDGGAFVLDCDTEPLATRRSLRPEYEAVSLSGRAREAVSYSETIRGELSASGYLVGTADESTHERLLGLLEARHALYRAPSGETAHVAVTGVEYTRCRAATSVEVKMIEVGA